MISIRSLSAHFLLFAALAPLIGLVQIARADVIDDYIETRMRREHIPGLSLAIVRDGRIVKIRGYGRASLELNVLATPDTVYELASTTKPFVAAAIMLLVQDGKLRLDDSASKFVPNTPNAWKTITLRQLLSHTSGIKDYLSDMRQDFPQDTPPEKIVQAAMDAGSNFPPGQKWQYSNTGYVLLGMVIHAVTGKTYDEFVRDRIFLPLGMTQTRRDSPDEVIANRAIGYLWYGGAFHNAEFLRYLMTNHGDRGILSTVGDMAKWDAALNSNRLLTADSKKLLWTSVRLADGSTAEYGLGWFVKNINGHVQISHPGGAPGTAAMFSRYPGDRLTVILLANGGQPYMQELDLGIARHYISGLFPAMTLRLPPAALDSYAGYYNAYGSQLLRVKRMGAGLYIDDGGGVNNDFLPVSQTDFVAPEAERGFSVSKSAKGDVTGALLQLGKDKMSVQRIGPLLQTLQPGIDPDPILTSRIVAVLKAFSVGGGGMAVQEALGLAPQAREDFSRGPAVELQETKDVSYIGFRNIVNEGITRHGAAVTRVIYYWLNTDHGRHAVLVYLTADNLVTDEDVVLE